MPRPEPSATARATAEVGRSRARSAARRSPGWSRLATEQRHRACVRPRRVSDLCGSRLSGAIGRTRASRHAQRGHCAMRRQNMDSRLWSSTAMLGTTAVLQSRRKAGFTHVGTVDLDPGLPRTHAHDGTRDDLAPCARPIAATRSPDLRFGARRTEPDRAIGAGPFTRTKGRSALRVACQCGTPCCA